MVYLSLFAVKYNNTDNMSQCSKMEPMITSAIVFLRLHFFFDKSYLS